MKSKHTATSYCAIWIIIISTLVSILNPSIVFSQDILYMKSGEERKAIVKYVSIDRIEYIRFDNQDGPIYELNKGDLLKIVYENGTVDYFEVESRDADDKLKQEQVFFDERDSTSYKYVTIGNQVWMAENMTFKVGQSICYEGQPDYCDECGRYYNFEEAKEVCPNGWHLPTVEEWMELEREVGMTDFEAVDYGWRGSYLGQAPSLRKDGKTGLDLLFCGWIRQTNKSGKSTSFIPYDITKDGYFWTASENDENETFIRHIDKGKRSIQKILPINYTGSR